MVQLRPALLLAFCLQWCDHFAASIKIFSSPGALPTSIPAACRAALSGDIACGPRLIRPNEVEHQVPLGNELLVEWCNSSCTSSIMTWTSNVHTRCGATKHDFGENITQSGDDIAQPLLWAHNVSCLTDGQTQAFCLPMMANNTVKLCDDCSLKSLAARLGSAFGAADMDEGDFTSLLARCSASPTKYPHGTASSTETGATPTASANATACYGTTYAVRMGDTCASIAAANRVAVDRFIYQNGLDFNCNSLSVGSSVCIGSDESCSVYMIKDQDTCLGILKGREFTLTELLAWNPVIHSTCDNMGALEGRTICVSPPGSDAYNVTVTVSWTDSWTTPSGSWVSAPTVGTPVGNDTAFSTEWSLSVGTVTVTGNATAASTYQQYITHCPVTDDDVDQGFDWEMVPESCSDLLESYCDPVGTGPVPSEPTAFPTSCLPSAIMGW